MKNLVKLAALGAALAVSTSLAFADSVTVVSYGATGLSGTAFTGVGNATQYAGNFGLNTVAAPSTPPPALGSFTAVNTSAVNLNPEVPTWNAALAGSSWVGINANAGPQSTTNPQYGYYEFTSAFTLAGGVYGATINVMADDTTEVLLDGTLIPGLGLGVLGTDVHCADNKPTCIQLDSVSFTTGNLAAGSHTLQFIVEQGGNYNSVGSDPSGLDFTANFSQTPEPSSLMLLGTGLTGAAGMLFRRRRTA